MRVVFDTNVMISAVVFDSPVPRDAIELGFAEHTPLASDATLEELVEVMGRDKFRKLASARSAYSALAWYQKETKLVAVSSIIRASRDPKDDKFLELAVDGRADCIVTGDLDLLELHPFEGIAILSASEFMERFG